MKSSETMDIKLFRAILSNIHKQHGNYEVWLSNDEEGNTFIRMLKNTAYSLGIDDEKKRIILFPSGCNEDMDNH